MMHSVLLQRLRATALSLLLSPILSPSLLCAETYYVDAENGEDSRNSVQARSPVTPWQTLERAAQESDVRNGDTIIVKPGVYSDILKPRDNHMTWRAEPRWGAFLEPTAEDGTIVTDEAAVKVDNKDGVIIDGFVIHGGSTGVRYEDADGGVIRNNIIYGAQFQGILLDESANILIEGNRVFSNGVSTGGGAGIKGTRGAGLVVRGNLVYANADQGVSLEGQGSASLNNVIESNTVDSNGKDGIRLTGPVGQTTITNNIITRNGASGVGIGLKIPSNCCPPLVSEDYNNSWGNRTADFDLPSGTAPSPTDLSVDPLYLDPNGADNILGGAGWKDDRYHLAHRATGQLVDSPCVDTGAPTVVVDGATAVDNVLDEGVPDRGFHYFGQVLQMQQLTFTKAQVLFQKHAGQFFVSSILTGEFTLGLGNNGIDLSLERIRIDLDAFTQTLPAGSCTATKKNQHWRCKGARPGVSIVVIDTKKKTFTIKTVNIPALSSSLPASSRLTLHLGGDQGSAEQSYSKGWAEFP